MSNFFLADSSTPTNNFSLVNYILGQSLEEVLQIQPTTSFCELFTRVQNISILFCTYFHPPTSQPCHNHQTSFKVAIVALTEAISASNWTSAVTEKLEALSRDILPSFLQEQLQPLLDLSSASPTTLLTSLTAVLAAVIASLFIFGRSMYADRASFSRIGGGRSPYAAYANRDPSGHSFADHVDYLDEGYNVVQTQAIDDDDSPDILHLDIAGASYTFEFDPYSIAEEKVTVRDLRERVARIRKIEPGRVKLMYKDHELRRNEAPLRKYGCKQNSEIMVIIMSESRNYDRRDASDSDSYSSKPSQENRRSRSYSTNRPRDRTGREPEQIRTTYTGSNGFLHPHGTPTTSSPRVGSPVRTTARAPSPTATSAPRPPPPRAIQKPTADPSTNLGKIQAIAYEYHTEWQPSITDFIRNPPQEKDDRTKEYRRLSDIAEKRVFLAGDVLDIDGPQKEEIRATRKQLYAEVHADLKELDRFKPKE